MKKIISILTVVLFTSQTLRAQTEETSIDKDLETWSGVEFVYDINSKFSLSFDEQLRLKENSSTIDEYFTELSGKYDIWRGFSLGAGLRFIRSNDSNGKIQGYENHLRYQIDVSFKHKIERLDIKYRFRYQNKSELGSENPNKAQTRLKLNLDYNFNHWKFDPEISGEIFSPAEGYKLEKYRITIGTSFKLGKSGKLNAFYGFEGSNNSEALKQTNIIGLSYKYKLNAKGK